MAGGADGVDVGVAHAVDAVGVEVGVGVEEVIVNKGVVPNVALVRRVSEPHAVGVVQEGVVGDVCVYCFVAGKRCCVCFDAGVVVLDHAVPDAEGVIEACEYPSACLVGAVEDGALAVEGD